MPYKEDPKRKHDGTIEYTSRDAHKGLGTSRFLLVAYHIGYGLFHVNSSQFI